MAKPFNEEDTFIGGHKPINGYVKDLLGDPTKLHAILEDLTYEQKIGLALVKMSEAFDRLLTTGCAVGAENARSIGKLEGWRSWVIGGLAAVAATMGFILFILTIVKGANP